MRWVVDLDYPFAWENPHALSDERVVTMKTYLCQWTGKRKYLVEGLVSPGAGFASCKGIERTHACWKDLEHLRL